jgi:predicted transglutaminase-like cysteine proteinase
MIDPPEERSMSQTIATLAAGLFAAATAGGCAEAQSGPIHELSAASRASISAGDETRPQKSSKIRFGELSATPSGYYFMCVGHPSLCRTRAGRIAMSPDGSVVLTDAALNQLNAVNAKVNAAIEPAYRDAWTPEQPAGDCKDFAMTKRQRLIESGWPSSALPVAIVRTSLGEKHLVLVARTSRGDFVLDNLADAIAPWTSPSYSWEKILSPTDDLVWRTVATSTL